jgi:hypothetical protein
MIPVVIEKVYTCMQKNHTNIRKYGIKWIYGSIFPVSNRKAVTDCNY